MCSRSRWEAVAGGSAWGQKYLGAPRASPPRFLVFSVVLSSNGERAGFIIELARHATRDTSASDTPDSAALTLVTDV